MKTGIKQFFCFLTVLLGVITATETNQAIAESDKIDYAKEIQPILNRYCSSCHSDAEKEAGFSTESFQSLQKGIEGNSVLTSDEKKGPLLLRVLSSEAESSMPPEDEPQPTKKELELLRSWIKSGARGPNAVAMNRLEVETPTLKPFVKRKPITAIAISKAGTIAVGRFKEILLFQGTQKKELKESRIAAVRPWHQEETLPGKVNGLSFSPDGKRLAIASGVSGRGGFISVFNLETKTVVQTFSGHLDLIYDIEFSPDGKQLATCSYDKTIILWETKTGEKLRTFSGHNGPIYDVSFSPDGKTLLSASADDTCKLWRVKDGLRLDTLGQPLKEEFACTFNPSGTVMAAVGADKKLRLWKYVSNNGPQINPQIEALFAHETEVSHLLWNSQRNVLLTIAQNGILKLWNGSEFREIYRWDEQPKGLISVVADDPRGSFFVVGRLEGTLGFYPYPASSDYRGLKSSGHQKTPLINVEEKVASSVTEQEPNGTPKQANSISIPAQVTGKIQKAEGQLIDRDFFRFSAKKSEQWIFEIRAAQDQSLLDSHLEVLTSSGEKIKRVNLQAVRESYFTFRGKNSDQANDFRIFNWTEMKLNEYLYANGEVTRFYHYPRGADSGFNVYPFTGKRWGYFDTTPLSHALSEPCYVVRPYEVGEEIVPNGLPVFPIYFENDDASLRDLGNDSRLFFVAPKTGDYLVKVSDVRGESGEKYSYFLKVRSPKRDYVPKILDRKRTLFPGSRQEFRLGITRKDGYQGPVKFICSSTVPGIKLTSPVVIEEGHIEARGVISVAEGQVVDKELLSKIKISSEAMIDGKLVRHEVPGFTELKAGGPPKLTLEIVPSPSGVKPVSAPGAELLEFAIEPGQTILLKVVANRNGHKGPIPFGREDSGRNLPFGMFVDNIGLNGLLITENSNEREFFITCDPVTKPQSRLFHLSSSAAGGQATQPVLLHIRSPRQTVKK